MKRIALTALAALILATPTLAVATKTMDMIDFIIDREDLIGQEVTVTDCKMVSPDDKDFGCLGPVVVRVAWPKGAREDKRRGLLQCGGYLYQGPQCLVTVTGKVGTVVVRGGIFASSLIWNNPAQ